MDLWTIGSADASVACLRLVRLASSRLKVVVLQPTVISSFGCFVFEIWVLRASVFVFECFVFETTAKVGPISSNDFQAYFPFLHSVASFHFICWKVSLRN